MFVLVLMLSCVHRSVPSAVDENGLPIAYQSDTVKPLPFKQCVGEFDLDLSGIDLGEHVGGWVNGEVVYIHEGFPGGAHYVSCMVDWTCPHPTPLPGGLGMGCIDQTACCDLGAVQKN